MAKSIMLGNGAMLVGLDQYGQVKDLYYPYAGLENHISHNLVHKIGLHVDDQFTWFSDGSWKIEVKCEKDTMASEIIAEHHELGLVLHLNDIVYNEESVLIREINVENTFDRKRKVKLFFNQQFTIAQTYSGDTAYYDPVDNVMIHYRGRRVFLANLREDKNGISDYSIGLLGIEGKEGTYKDAEDGKLSKNPIEHGQVDSVASIEIDVSAKGRTTLYYWIIAGESIEHVKKINQEIIIRGPEDISTTTKNYWKAWVNVQNFNFYGMSDSAISLFKHSLLYIRAHVNDNGSIIASGDSDMLQFGRDYYEYVWPRDGAYATLSLMKAGDFNASRRFFEFCNDVISEKGYFMHKYRPDKALGSSWHPWISEGVPQFPIQEDETAIVLFALWNYYELTRDLEFIERIYNSFIKKAAEFMVSYRDEKTGLPKASYDLWEMYYGISTYTASSVYGALKAASKFAKLLGKTDSEKRYEEASETIKKGIMKYLYNEKSDTFYKYLKTSKRENYIDETIDFSSVFGIFKFGVLESDDKKLRKSFETYIERLTVKTDAGGIARFEGDIYNHVGGDYPGNPWIITSLWLAQYHISQAKKEADMAEVQNLLSWVVNHASLSDILPEQLDPYSGNHISATPLVWSHSEFVTTVVLYLEKLDELGVCEKCYPMENKN